MRINGQQPTLIVAQGPAQLPQGQLQALRLRYSVGIEELMNRLIGADKGLALGQFKAFL